MFTAMIITAISIIITKMYTYIFFYYVIILF